MSGLEYASTDSGAVFGMKRQYNMLLMLHGFDPLRPLFCCEDFLSAKSVNKKPVREFACENLLSATSVRIKSNGKMLPLVVFDLTYIFFVHKY